MTDTSIDVPETPKSNKKLKIVLWAVLALAGAGAGYFAVSKNLIPIGKSHTWAASEHGSTMPDIAFVPIEPIVISLNSNQAIQHLRFRAQLEVPTSAKGDVEYLLPRIVDVLNGYLRALRLDDLRDPLALTRLRAQMLRRIKIVAGDDQVRDLLIMEFVLN